MGTDAMVDEYEDEDQRYAMCNSLWKKAKEKKSVAESKSERTHDQLDDFEYLIHHVEVDKDGEEEIHHCFLYDHIANLFTQGHLVIKNGKGYLDGKKVKDGVFHVLTGLEPTQEVAWSDEEAEENNIKPKKLFGGMTFKEKAKEW